MSDAKTWEICTSDLVVVHMIADGYSFHDFDYDGNVIPSREFYGFDLEWNYVDSCDGYTTPPPAATDFFSTTSSYVATTNWPSTSEPHTNFDPCTSFVCMNGGTVR